MTELSDEELHARFDALRTGDERGAPEFHAILDRPARTAYADGRSASRWRLKFALSIAAGALLAVGLTRAYQRRAFVPQPLSTWTSPTANLLVTPGSALLASSTWQASVLDHLIAMASQRKGN